MINLYIMIGCILVIAKSIFFFVALRKFELMYSKYGMLVAIVTLIIDLIAWPFEVIFLIGIKYSERINKLWKDGCKDIYC